MSNSLPFLFWSSVFVAPLTLNLSAASATSPTAYEMLGCPDTADDQQVRHCYEHHDNPDSVEVRWAYFLVSSPPRREAYRRFRELTETLERSSAPLRDPRLESEVLELLPASAPNPPPEPELPQQAGLFRQLGQLLFSRWVTRPEADAKPMIEGKGLPESDDILGRVVALPQPDRQKLGQSLVHRPELVDYLLGHWLFLANESAKAELAEDRPESLSRATEGLLALFEALIRWDENGVQLKKLGRALFEVAYQSSSWNATGIITALTKIDYMDGRWGKASHSTFEHRLRALIDGAIEGAVLHRDRVGVGSKHLMWTTLFSLNTASPEAIRLFHVITPELYRSPLQMMGELRLHYGGLLGFGYDRDFELEKYERDRVLAILEGFVAFGIVEPPQRKVSSIDGKEFFYRGPRAAAGLIANALKFTKDPRLTFTATDLVRTLLPEGLRDEFSPSLWLTANHSFEITRQPPPGLSNLDFAKAATLCLVILGTASMKFEKGMAQLIKSNEIDGAEIFRELNERDLLKEETLAVLRSILDDEVYAQFEQARRGGEDQKSCRPWRF